MNFKQWISNREIQKANYELHSNYIWNPRRHMVENKTKIYFGLASTTFKVRQSNHNTSINLAAYRKNTALSVEVWKLKDQSINYDLKFSIVKLAPTYSRESKFCGLCLQEKVCILFSSSTDHVGILNKRSKILYKCKHRDRHLFQNWWFLLVVTRKDHLS